MLPMFKTSKPKGIPVIIKFRVPRPAYEQGTPENENLTSATHGLKIQLVTELTPNVVNTCGTTFGN